MSWLDDVANFFAQNLKKNVENAQKTTEATQPSISAPLPVNNVPSNYHPEPVQSTVTTTTGDKTYTDNSAAERQNNAVAFKNTISQMAQNAAYNNKKNVDNAIATTAAVQQNNANPFAKSPYKTPNIVTTTTGDRSTDEVYKAAGAGLKAIASGNNADKAMQKESAETISDTLKNAQSKIDEANRKNAEYTETLNHSVTLKAASDLARSYTGGISSALNGTVAGIGNAGRTFAYMNGDKELADKFGSFASDANDAEVQAGLDKDNQFAGTIIGDLAKTTGQMLPQTILGIATGGAQAAGEIGLGLMGASVYGNESNKAFNQLGADGNLTDADYLRANLYAGAKAATEVATEHLDNALPGMKMGLNQFAEEGLEEVVGGLVDPFSDQILNANSLQEAGQNIAKTFTSGDFYADLAKQGMMGSLSAIVSSSPHLLDANYRKSLVNETVTYLEHKNDKAQLSLATHLYNAYKNGMATETDAAVAVQTITQVCNGENGIGGVLTPISMKYYDNNGRLNVDKFDEAFKQGKISDITDNPLSAENGDYKQTAQKANFSNIVMNLQETAGVDEKTARNYAKLSNKMGTPIIFTKTPITTDSGASVDACIKPNGVIYVNINSQNSLSEMISHEFVHATEKSPQYAKLTSALDSMYKSGMFQDKTNVLSSIDTSTTLDDAAKLRERTAVLTGSLLNNPDAIRQIANTNLPTAKYILETLKNWGNGDSNVTNSTINTLRKAINDSSAPSSEETYVSDKVKEEIKPKIKDALKRMGVKNSDLAEGKGKIALNLDTLADNLTNSFNLSNVDEFLSGNKQDISVKAKNMSRAYEEYLKNHVGEDDTPENRESFFTEQGFNKNEVKALVNNTSETYSSTTKNLLGTLRDKYGKNKGYDVAEKELIYLLDAANGGKNGIVAPSTLNLTEDTTKPVAKTATAQTVNERANSLSDYLSSIGLNKSRSKQFAEKLDSLYDGYAKEMSNNNKHPDTAYPKALTELRNLLGNKAPADLTKQIVSILKGNTPVEASATIETQEAKAPEAETEKSIVNSVNNVNSVNETQQTAEAPKTDTVTTVTPEEVQSRRNKFSIGDEVKYTSGNNSISGNITKIAVDSKGREYVTISKTGTTDLTYTNGVQPASGTSRVSLNNVTFTDSALEKAWNEKGINTSVEEKTSEVKPVQKAQPAVEEKPVETVVETPVEEAKPAEKVLDNIFVRNQPKVDESIDKINGMLDESDFNLDDFAVKSIAEAYDRETNAKIIGQNINEKLSYKSILKKFDVPKNVASEITSILEDGYTNTAEIEQAARDSYEHNKKIYEANLAKNALGQEAVKPKKKPVEKPVVTEQKAPTEKEAIKQEVSKKIETAKSDIKLSLEDAVKKLETDTSAKLKPDYGSIIDNTAIKHDEVGNMDNAVKKALSESKQATQQFVDNSKQLANMVLNNTEGLKLKKQKKLVAQNLGEVVENLRQTTIPTTPQDAISREAEKVAQASKNSSAKIDVNAFVDGLVATEPVEREMTRESLIEKHLKEAYEKDGQGSTLVNKNLSPKTLKPIDSDEYYINKTLKEVDDMNLPDAVKAEIKKLVKAKDGSVSKQTFHLLENQERKFALIDSYGIINSYNEVMNNFDVDPDTNEVTAKNVTKGDITFTSAVLSRLNDSASTLTNNLISMLKNRTDFDGKTLYQVKKYMASHNTDANITSEMKSLLKVVNTYDYMAKNVALGAGAYTNTAGVALNEAKLLRESFLTMSGEMRKAKLEKDIETMNKYIVENTKKGKKFLEQNNGSDYLASKHPDNPEYYPQLMADYEDAVNSGDEELAEQVFEKFKSSIQKDTPYTAGEVLRSLRFYHMLANPKTHLKNIVGNTFMAAMNASKNANQMVVESLLKSKVMHHDALTLTDTDYQAMADKVKMPVEEVKSKIEELGMNYFNRKSNAITQAIKEYNDSLTGADVYAKRYKFFTEKGFSGDTLDMLLNKKDMKVNGNSGFFSLSDANKSALSSRAEIAVQNELISQMKAGKVTYDAETGHFNFTDKNGEYKFANSIYNNAVNKYIDESELKTAKVNRQEKKTALEFVKHLQKTGYLDMGTKWEKDTANTLLQGRAALPMFSEGTGIGSKIANLTPNIINKMVDINSNGFKSVQEGGYLSKKFYNNQNIPLLSSFGLDNEDRADFQLATSTALAMDLKKKGYTISKNEDGTWSINGKSESESLKTISKMLDDAKVVGQEAVYRDNNKLIDAANRYRRENKLFDVVLDATIPFMKTPANIVRRGIEYSPVSLATSAMLKKKVMNGEISASDYITKVSKGMAGSELAVMGAIMGMYGIVSGKDDDDDYNAKQYKQSIYGYQDYSLNIGGHHFNIEDFAPASSIVLGGVAVADAVKAAMQGQEGNENYFGDAIDMCKGIISGYYNSIADTTMLQNIQDIQKAFGEADDKDSFSNSILNVLANYGSSMFPPILKWAGQIADDTERVTYSSDAQENLKLKALQAVGMSYMLQPKLDSKGNEIKKEDFGLGGAGRAYDIFLNIFKDSKDTHTEADDKILELYKQTGDDKLLGGTQSYFTDNGNKTTLSGTEQTEYNKVYKSTLNSELGKYLTSDAYAHADDEMKKSVLSGIKSFATAEAIKSYYQRTNAVDIYSAMSDSMKELDDLVSKKIMSPYQYYTYNSIKGIEGVTNSKGLLVRNAMETAGTYDAYIDAYKSGKIHSKSLVSNTVAEMTDEEFDYEYNKLTNGLDEATQKKSEDELRSSFVQKLSDNQDMMNLATKADVSGDNLYSVLDTYADKDSDGKSISHTQDIKARQKAIENGTWDKIVDAVNTGKMSEEQAIALTGISQAVFELNDDAFQKNLDAMSSGVFSGKLADNTSRWYHVATQKYSSDLTQRNKLVQNGTWAKLVEQVNNGTITAKEAMALSGVGKTVFELNDDSFNANYAALANGTYNGKLTSTGKWASVPSGPSGTVSSSSSTKTTSTKKTTAQKTAEAQQKAQLALYKKYVSSSNASSSKIKTSVSADSQQSLYNSIMSNHNKNINSLKSKYKLS